ncbi:hypothetical protein RL1906 [Rhizobium johnstonii 3841]|uniref:Uncharacterized protein n=1 Tax=Rhizobium johnstonii (strain DSM 114642 / LMG 32736 / 3841) TaxID=216596 RepID=Q1MI11_RHIJ3|nr:hypothetical protein RL1906 [Rhizobium johnstonii 3841]
MRSASSHRNWLLSRLVQQHLRGDLIRHQDVHVSATQRGSDRRNPVFSNSCGERLRDQVRTVVDTVGAGETFDAGVLGVTREAVPAQGTSSAGKGASRFRFLANVCLSCSLATWRQSGSCRKSSTRCRTGAFKIDELV